MTTTAPPASAERPGQAAYRSWAQRRVLRALVVAQIFGGAGLAAGVSVGALLAEDLLGSTSSAGLPAALFTAGGAGVVLASVTENVPLFLVSLLVYGAGSATNLQGRYAGADLADESRRGRAVSTVLVATTLGAVAGPNLLRLTGDLAEAIDLPRLSGPFMLASAVYAAAGIVIAVLLRPDPLLTARQLAATNADLAQPAPKAPQDAPHESILSAEVSAWWQRRRPLVLAASGMVIAQAVMVAVMTMTPVHLKDHHHDLSAVGLIIGLHIGAMYLPSPLTGHLVDRFSPATMTAAGGAVLVTAGRSWTCRPSPSTSASANGTSAASSRSGASRSSSGAIPCASTPTRSTPGSTPSASRASRAPADTSQGLDDHLRFPGSEEVEVTGIPGEDDGTACLDGRGDHDGSDRRRRPGAAEESPGGPPDRLVGHVNLADRFQNPVDRRIGGPTPDRLGHHHGRHRHVGAGLERRCQRCPGAHIGSGQADDGAGVEDQALRRRLAAGPRHSRRASSITSSGIGPDSASISASSSASRSRWRWRRSASFT